MAPEHTAPPSGLGRIVSVEEILAILRRFWKEILLCAVLAMAGALALMLIEGRSYVAQTSMLVKLGREQLTALQVSPMDSPNAVFTARPEAVNNEIEILRDPSLSMAVFPALKARLEALPPSAREPSLARRILGGLQHLAARTADLLKAPLYSASVLNRLTPDQALMLRFYHAFHVGTVKQTDIISLAFEWSDPDFAAFALGQYVNAYRARHIEVHTQANGSEIYRAQIEVARKAVAAAEQALIDFRRAHMAASPDFQHEAAVSEVVSLKRERGGLQVDIDELGLRKRALAVPPEATNAWDPTPPSLATPIVTALDEHAVEVVTRIDRLAGTTTAGSRELKAAEDELARLRARKRALVSRQIAAQLATDQQRASLLDARITEQIARIEDASEDGIRLARLQGELDLRRATLDQYERTYERMRVDEELNHRMIASLYQIADAQVPIQPSGPRPLLILAIAGFVGVMLGLVLALIRGLSDTRLRGAEDARRALGLPVVGMVARAR